MRTPPDEALLAQADAAEAGARAASSVHAQAGSTIGSDGKRPLVVVGDYAWDVLIRTNTALLTGGDTFGEVQLAPGGSAANAAVWASRCGLPTTFVGKVGRDRFGSLAESDLRDERVEAYLIQTEAQLTGSVAVWIDHTGQRSMVSGKGADHALFPQELPRPLLATARHLHLSAWSLFDDPPRAAAREAARLVRRAGGTVSLDPGSFQMIEAMGVETFLEVTRELGVAVVFPNAEEAATLSQEHESQAMTERLAAHYPGALVALKLDAEGAYVRRPDGSGGAVPPHVNRLVDATGAGDAFAGAFLSRWLAGRDAVEAARFAVWVSEWVIQHVGARPVLDATMRDDLERRRQA
jgi:ribokinase